MAEFVSVDQGTGINVAVDNISGTSYQYVKLDVGAPGYSNPVSSSLPVNIASGTLQFNSYSASEGVTSATTLASSINFGATITSPTYLIITNIGPDSIFVSPISGGHTWPMGPNSTLQIPISSIIPLYVCAERTTSTLYCIWASNIYV